MKKIVSLFLIALCVALLFVGCDKGRRVTIDVASSVNFRCEVYISNTDESFITSKDSGYLFENCYENKENATKLKSDKVAIGTSYIKLNFVGDCVDNAPVLDGKADYGRFVIFSNDTVRFEYDNTSQYYQFENGFYNLINNYMIIFVEKD